MTSRERIDRIRQSMREQGLTNQQLADMSQISASTVSRTLAGKTEPEQHTLEAMESAIGITDKPIADPAMPKGNIDQSAQLYINLMEMRISRMRAHYNMLLAEKRRWIVTCVAIILILLIVLICSLIFDASHPSIGWIQ